MSKILRFEQTETQRLLKILTKSNNFVEVPAQFGKQTYTGEEQVVRLPFIDWDRLEYGGDLSAIYAGTYIATVKPRPGIKWADGTDDTKQISWTIDKKKILWTEIIAPEFYLIYFGFGHYPIWCKYDGQWHHPFWSENTEKYGLYIECVIAHPNYQPQKAVNPDNNAYVAKAELQIQNAYEFETDENITKWWTDGYGTLTAYSIQLYWGITS